MDTPDVNDGSLSDWADRLPAVNYFEKSIDLVASYDRLLTSLYSALIAGIVLLLLNQEVSLWVGAALLMALVFFVMGIAHTLLHMAFMSKMLLLAEALVNGTEVVPNAVEEEEPTVQAYARNQAYAQRAYASQLFYMLAGMVFGAVAVVIRLWDYAWRAGVIGIVAFVVLVAVVVLVVAWKKVLRRFPPARVRRKSANEVSKETD